MNGYLVSDRKCPFCLDVVKDEQHVILVCPLYNDLREILYHRAVARYTHFHNLNNTEKITYLFKDENLVRTLAKTCFLILNRRSSFLYV